MDVNMDQNNLTAGTETQNKLQWHSELWSRHAKWAAQSSAASSWVEIKAVVLVALFTEYNILFLLSFNTAINT